MFNKLWETVVQKVRQLSRPLFQPVASSTGVGPSLFLPRVARPTPKHVNYHRLFGSVLAARFNQRLAYQLQTVPVQSRYYATLLSNATPVLGLNAHNVFNKQARQQQNLFSLNDRLVSQEQLAITEDTRSQMKTVGKPMLSNIENRQCTPKEPSIAPVPRMENFLAKQPSYHIVIKALLSPPPMFEVDRFASSQDATTQSISSYLLDHQFFTEFDAMKQEHEAHLNQLRGFLTALLKNGRHQISFNEVHHGAIVEISVSIPWPHRQPPDSMELDQILSKVGIEKYRSILEIEVRAAENRIEEHMSEKDAVNEEKENWGKTSVEDFLAHINAEIELRNNEQNSEDRKKPKFA